MLKNIQICKFRKFTDKQNGSLMIKKQLILNILLINNFRNYNIKKFHKIIQRNYFKIKTTSKYLPF